MPRKVFDFSRLRLRQPRGGGSGEASTAGETTTAADSRSHENLSRSPSHASQNSLKLYKGASSISSGHNGDPMSHDEVDRMIRLKHHRPPSTHKHNNLSSNQRKKHTGNSDASVAAPPPSHGVMIELQNSIDFLTTKLEQSESRVRALQSQNDQLSDFVDNFLEEQDNELLKADTDVSKLSSLLSQEGAKENLNASNNDNQSFFQWAFGGGEAQEEEPNIPNDPSAEDSDLSAKSSASSTSSKPNVFTKEDAISRMTQHYHTQVEKLVKEKNGLAKKVKKLTFQNKCQAETMASLQDQIVLEKQRSKQQQQSNYFMDTQSERGIRSSSSRVSRSSHRSTKSRRSRSGRNPPADYSYEERRPTSTRSSSYSRRDSFQQDSQSIRRAKSNWTNATGSNNSQYNKPKGSPSRSSRPPTSPTKQPRRSPNSKQRDNGIPKTIIPSYNKGEVHHSQPSWDEYSDHHKQQVKKFML